MLRIAIVALLFLFTGCTSGGGISTAAFNALMTGTGEVGDDVVEASIVKEVAIIKGLMNRDDKRELMYGKSGFNMDWVEKPLTVLIQTAGQPETRVTISQYLPITSFRPEPRFQFALPTKPSVHPIWNTLESLGGIFAKYGLIGYGIHEFNSLLSTGFAAATQPNYSGSFYGSLNRSGTTQSIETYRDYITTDNSITNPVP